MIYEWDEAKRTANKAKHGVDFTAAEGFDWQTARVIQDTRNEYGEARFVALGENRNQALCHGLHATEGEGLDHQPQKSE